MSLYSYVHDFSSDSLLVSCVYFSFVIPYIIINHSVLNDLISSKRKSLAACHNELELIKIKITEFITEIQAVVANIETLLVECEHKTISVESRIYNLKALIAKSAKIIPHFFGGHAKTIRLTNGMTGRPTDTIRPATGLFSGAAWTPPPFPV